ncbi:unnamed protein product [Caenorhabditis nigoni]
MSAKNGPPVFSSNPAKDQQPEPNAEGDVPNRMSPSSAPRSRETTPPCPFKVTKCTKDDLCTGCEHELLPMTEEEASASMEANKDIAPIIPSIETSLKKIQKADEKSDGEVDTPVRMWLETELKNRLKKREREPESMDVNRKMTKFG